jgi:hypothetical protein
MTVLAARPSAPARAASRPLVHALGLPRLLLLWLGWAVLVLVFQSVVPLRLQLRRPDFAVPWTARETAANSQDNKPYLLEPFLNRQVSWDSEYYLSIALAGYDDPDMRVVAEPGTRRRIPLNYAFFPFYPLLMRAAMLPLDLLGLNPLATASLAGVVVALLGALVGLAALYDLARDSLGDDGALRAAFYLLIFPTGFFLAMVYTEGLFIALAFWVLALSRRGHWAWASLLSLLAPWTRAHGAALSLPLLVAWLRGLDRSRPLRPQFTLAFWLQGLAALAPFVSFLVWRLGPMGQNWKVIQEVFFGRGLLSWSRTLDSWGAMFAYAGSNSQGLVFAALEIGTVALAALAGLLLLRRQPEVALFSLALVALSAFSGVAQSMARYVLVAPATYLVLAHLGRRPVLDRLWTMVSLLLFALEALLFGFDMWVG